MLNNNWIEKLTIECIDEEGGGMTIQIEWDETDPDLQYWNDLGTKGQERFIIDALTQALEPYRNSDGI
jgi:hypothetical protein